MGLIARLPFAEVRVGASPAELDASFENAVQLHWGRIFRFILASVRDEGIAEELTQDCFWKAYKGWKRFRGDSSVSTWLMHIAVNVVKDFARNRKFQFWRRAPSVDITAVHDWLRASDLSPENGLVVQEHLCAVWDAVGSLSVKQRTAFLLRFVEDMELGEIAHVMGISEGAAKQHLFRAVRTIRKRLRIKL
jgi:RNA polymerase sigma-70 factor, ECF subfamily